MLSDELIAELKAADVILMSAPMYNFGITSTLKAWFDHVVRFGVTFKNGPAGPEGLLGDAKQVVIVSTRGQVYSEGPYISYDHQESYLKVILGFIGLKDISFIRAEGLIGGDEVTKAALEVAKKQTEKLVDELANMLPKVASVSLN
jgi:FMN-dependent NADH-azoreductase